MATPGPACRAGCQTNCQVITVTSHVCSNCRRQASGKGPGYGFGVQVVRVGIPLNMVQKWPGYAQLSTTAIFADAVGAEEKQIASRRRSCPTGK